MKKISSRIMKVVLTITMLLCSLCIYQQPTSAVSAVNTSNLDGKTFAIVNGARRYAITSNSVDDKYLQGIEYKDVIAQNSDGFYYRNTYTDEQKTAAETQMSSIKIWKFEKPENEEVTNNQYYMITEINGGTYYLDINGENLTIVDKPNLLTSLITVTEGSGDQAGLVRFTNSSGKAINLYGGQTHFGGYSDNSVNEYFYLIAGAMTIPLPEIVDDAVSPSGTVINLFDYWTDTRNAVDYNNDSEAIAKNAVSGINKEHAFKFTLDIDNMNKWTNSSAIYPNIVQNTLLNGYPVLSETAVNNVKNSSNDCYASDKENYKAESLAYLFDPAWTGQETQYRTAYRNVRGLLQQDKQGYYYYNSQENFAEFHEDTNSFTLYEEKGVEAAGNSPNGQFFPFNTFAESALNHSRSEEINHYFGMTLTSKFVQQHDGYTDSWKNTATTFEFSGDDDVWIFIDDVLVADLGGIHDAASVKIDFVTGEVIINKDDENKSTLYEAFRIAGKEKDIEWNGKTFANDTYHTLKFYYLERGNSDSNLLLKYNLQNYPATGIYKVNQYGNTLADATFAVYAADNNYNYLDQLNGNIVNLDTNNYSYDDNGNIIDEEKNVLVKALYYGVTDSAGQMTFVDEDNMPYTLDELEKQFGSYFILKEIQSPKGYRLLGEDIQLKITNDIIVCNNTYDTGVYMSPIVQMIASNHVKLYGETENGKSIIDVLDTTDGTNNVINGTLFAVVLKYNGEKNETELSKEANWSPVYGTSQDGFTVVNVNDANTFNGDFIAAVIDTAKRYKESQQIFKVSKTGQLEATLEGLPGDIQNYYYILKKAKQDITNTEYTIGYYWSSADSLEKATSSNTYRVDADYKNDNENYEIMRTFGASIEVPNLYNRMIVQKTDEKGNLVNGATFAMYEVLEVNQKIYYKANDGTLISLTAQENNFNEGAAITQDETSGIYKVNNETGDITVTINDKTYTIQPIEIDVTENQLKEEGTAVFEAMEAGQYYIREIKAPNGYRLNSSEIMVLVTNNSIYANAGTANDGITVGRGPGYVVSTMEQFASKGQIDNTLTWIYSSLKISDESTSFKDVNASDYSNSWQYITRNYANSMNNTTEDASEALKAYLKYAKGEADAIFNYDNNTERYSKDEIQTRRLYTNVGWSYLEIYQDYEYGSEHHTTGAHYEDLTNNGDISQLFSRSVYVKVTDQPEKLNIKKVDAANPNKVLSGAKFQLKRTVGKQIYYAKNENGNLSWVQAEADASTFVTDEKGIITIISGLYDGEYTLTEIKAPDGYVTISKDTEFIIENGVISGVDLEIEKTEDDIISVITISNVAGSEFAFKKTNKDEEALSGAGFVLYKLICTDENHNHNEEQIPVGSDGNITDEYKNCFEKVDSQISDETGFISFDLVYGETYRLIEFQTLDEYTLPDGQWIVKLNKNDETYTIDFEAIGYPPAFKEVTNKDGSISYSVINYRPSELPLTGYSGIMTIIMVGICITIIAIAWYLILRKRQLKYKN